MISLYRSTDKIHDITNYYKLSSKEKALNVFGHTDITIKIIEDLYDSL